jgi:hypothetical protein
VPPVVARPLADAIAPLRREIADVVAASRCHVVEMDGLDDPSLVGGLAGRARARRPTIGRGTAGETPGSLAVGRRGSAMRCACYRTDPPVLLAALSDPALVQRWLDQAADEVRGLADRALVSHIRELTRVASEVLGDGFERVAERDPHAADALLSDLLAVATWHGWELPIEALGDLDLPVEDLPRGLLAADQAREGASVWLLDDRTVALARTRVAGDQA